MTVAYNTPATLEYIGNGSTYQFPITFPTFEASNVKAEVVDADGVSTPLTLTTHYTLTNIGRTGVSGTLTLVNGAFDWIVAPGRLATGYSLFISFDVQAFQPQRLRDAGYLSPEVYEKVLDRLTMNVLAIRDLAKRSLGLAQGDGSAQLPPLAGNEDKILQVNDDASGIEYGPTAQSIFDAAQDAVDAAAAAATSSSTAATAASNAGTDATAAEGFAVSAAGQALAADASADAAAQSELASSQYVAEAEFWAKFTVYQQIVEITNAESPVTVTDADSDTLYLVDDTDGDVVFNLPALGTTSIAFKIGVLKTAGANQIQINPNGAETINNGAQELIAIPGIGNLIYAESPTDWNADYYVSASGGSGGGGSPDGGLTGEVLVKNSDADQDTIWESAAFDGFSARFNAAFTSTGLRDTLAKILDLQYLGPQVTLSATGSGTVREKGAPLASTTLTAAVTKRSDPIDRIHFKRAGATVYDENPALTVGSGNTNTVYNTPFSDNTSFTVEVTDNGDSGGPTTVTSNTVSFVFVYPYYYGSGAPGLSAVAVGALSKHIIASNATVNRVFTPSNGQVHYFAYPASYGALTSILDENGFETIGDWTGSTANITGLDGNAVSYRIYQFNNPVVAGTTNYTFKR